MIIDGKTSIAAICDEREYCVRLVSVFVLLLRPAVLQNQSLKTIRLIFNENDDPSHILCVCGIDGVVFLAKNTTPSYNYQNTLHTLRSSRYFRTQFVLNISKFLFLVILIDRAMAHN